MLPFYLQMMGLNAVRTDPELPSVDDLWPELVPAGRSVDLLDAKWLLNVGAWRPVVMGAWFSLRFSTAEIGVELRRAMERSLGSLTAPPLATACVLVAGVESLPELEHYVRTDPGDDGSAQFVAAAMEHLGALPPTPVSDGAYRERVQEMLTLGIRLLHDMSARD